MLIDTHAHLYDEKFVGDLPDLISRATSSGIGKMIIPGTTPEDSHAILELCSIYPQLCFPTLAIHPEDLKENFHEQLELLQKRMKEAKYYAVGETGLDLHWDKTRLEQQKEALVFQIQLASQLDLPLILHCRDAFEPLMEVLKQHRKSNTHGILHCFNGTQEDALQLINMNFMLGIGGTVTFKKSQLKETLREIGLKYVVLETDCPYISPVPMRGTRNEPSFLKYTANFLANELHIPLSNIEEITTQNAMSIFHLPK